MARGELKIGKLAYSLAEEMSLLDDLKELRKRVIAENINRNLSPRLKGLYGGILRDLGQVMDKKEGLK